MDLDQLSDRANREAQTEFVRQCQVYVENIKKLADPYRVDAISTNEPWSGRHRSALVYTENGPVVLDNGALGYGAGLLPMSVLAKMKKPYVIRQLGEDGQPMHAWPWEQLSKSALGTIVEMPEAMSQWRANTTDGPR